MAGSASICSHASTMASAISTLRALRRSGARRVMTATPSRRSSVSSEEDMGLTVTPALEAGDGVPSSGTQQPHERVRFQLREDQLRVRHATGQDEDVIGPGEEQLRGAVLEIARRRDVDEQDDDEREDAVVGLCTGAGHHTG